MAGVERKRGTKPNGPWQFIIGDRQDLELAIVAQP
jgi:hypothetical protein